MIVDSSVISPVPAVAVFASDADSAGFADLVVVAVG